MGKILTVVLGVGAVLGAAWYATRGAAEEAASRPDVEASPTLERTRAKAHELEQQLQRDAERSAAPGVE